MILLGLHGSENVITVDDNDSREGAGQMQISPWLVGDDCRNLASCAT